MGTDWLTTLLTAMNVPSAPRARPTASATRWAVLSNGTIELARQIEQGVDMAYRRDQHVTLETGR